MSYTYDIRPSPDAQRGGWSLHLFENGAEAGMVDFPAEEGGSAEAAFSRAEAEAHVWVKGRKVYSNRHRRLVVHPALAVLLGLAVVTVFYNILKYAL